ncbi:MAG TPA: helix-turn-helix domain-containing protein [Thermoanaerobaculia bacterium]|jgi:AcrR family transcriptional regulator
MEGGVELPGGEPAGERTRRGRGRPRREGTEEEILTVARQVLHERGYREFTVDSISELTGIAKTTIYRRFASKSILAAAALAPMQRLSERDDLASVLREAAGVLRLIAEPERDAMDIVRAVVRPRRAALRELLAADPPLRTRHEPDLAADLLIGALLARLLDGRDLGDEEELIRAIL